MTHAESSWHLRMIEFTKELAKMQVAIQKAEGAE